MGTLNRNSPPEVDTVEYGFGAYYNKIPICPIFFPLKGDYDPNNIAGI